MSAYIRRRTKGASYFFTIRLADRTGDLLVAQVKDLRAAMRATQERHPFSIDAICVLPAVIHTIWTLPPEEDNYPTRVGMLKSRFSRGMPMPAHRTLTQIKRAEKGIWQRRYWEHEIRDATDMQRHRDMIYLAPVHAGLCAHPQDWLHSSLHRDLRQGVAAPVPIGHGAGGLHLTGSMRKTQNEDVAYSG